MSLIKKRKILYLKILNRFLKEEKLYHNFWKNCNKTQKDSILNRIENAHFNRILASQQGTIKEFRNVFAFNMYYKDNYMFWNEISNKWLNILNYYYYNFIVKK